MTVLDKSLGAIAKLGLTIINSLSAIYIKSAINQFPLWFCFITSVMYMTFWKRRWRGSSLLLMESSDPNC